MSKHADETFCTKEYRMSGTAVYSSSKFSFISIPYVKINKQFEI